MEVCQEEKDSQYRVTKETRSHSVFVSEQYKTILHHIF